MILFMGNRIRGLSEWLEALRTALLHHSITRSEKLLFFLNTTFPLLTEICKVRCKVWRCEGVSWEQSNVLVPILIESFMPLGGWLTLIGYGCCSSCYIVWLTCASFNSCDDSFVQQFPIFLHVVLLLFFYPVEKNALREIFEHHFFRMTGTKSSTQRTGREQHGSLSMTPWNKMYNTA